MSGFPTVDPRSHQVALAKCELAEFVLSNLADKYSLSHAEVIYILTELASTSAGYLIRVERQATQERAT